MGQTSTVLGVVALVAIIFGVIGTLYLCKCPLPVKNFKDNVLNPTLARLHTWLARCKRASTHQRRPMKMTEISDVSQANSGSTAPARDPRPALDTSNVVFDCEDSEVGHVGFDGDREESMSDDIVPEPVNEHEMNTASTHESSTESMNIVRQYEDSDHDDSIDDNDLDGQHLPHDYNMIENREHGLRFHASPSHRRSSSMPILRHHPMSPIFQSVRLPPNNRSSPHVRRNAVDYGRIPSRSSVLLRAQIFEGFAHFREDYQRRRRPRLAASFEGSAGRTPGYPDSGLDDLDQHYAAEASAAPGSTSSRVSQLDFDQLRGAARGVERHFCERHAIICESLHDLYRHYHQYHGLGRDACGCALCIYGFGESDLDLDSNGSPGSIGDGQIVTIDSPNSSGPLPATHRDHTRDFNTEGSIAHRTAHDSPAYDTIRGRRGRDPLSVLAIDYDVDEGYYEPYELPTHYSPCEEVATPMYKDPDQQMLADDSHEAESAATPDSVSSTGRPAEMDATQISSMQRQTVGSFGALQRFEPSILVEPNRDNPDSGLDSSGSLVQDHGPARPSPLREEDAVGLSGRSGNLNMTFSLALDTNHMHIPGAYPASPAHNVYHATTRGNSSMRLSTPILDFQNGAFISTPAAGNFNEDFRHWRADIIAETVAESQPVELSSQRRPASMLDQLPPLTMVHHLVTTRRLLPLQIINRYAVRSNRSNLSLYHSRLTLVMSILQDVNWWVNGFEAELESLFRSDRQTARLVLLQVIREIRNLPEDLSAYLFQANEFQRTPATVDSRHVADLSFIAENTSTVAEILQDLMQRRARSVDEVKQPAAQEDLHQQKEPRRRQLPGLFTPSDWDSLYDCVQDSSVTKDDTSPAGLRVDRHHSFCEEKREPIRHTPVIPAPDARNETTADIGSDAEEPPAVLHNILTDFDEDTFRPNNAQMQANRKALQGAVVASARAGVNRTPATRRRGSTSMAARLSAVRERRLAHRPTAASPRVRIDVAPRPYFSTSEIDAAHTLVSLAHSTSQPPPAPHVLSLRRLHLSQSLQRATRPSETTALGSFRDRVVCPTEYAPGLDRSDRELTAELGAEQESDEEVLVRCDDDDGPTDAGRQDGHDPAGDDDAEHDELYDEAW